jgi:hypothetical protein
VHPVDLVYGIAPYIGATDELIEAMRGPVPEDLRGKRKKVRR